MDVWQVLARLPQLQQVDLSHQFLYGALPANLSFASLEGLTLTTTYLTVGIGSLSSVVGLQGAKTAFSAFHTKEWLDCSGIVPSLWSHLFRHGSKFPSTTPGPELLQQQDSSSCTADPS